MWRHCFNAMHLRHENVKAGSRYPSECVRMCMWRHCFTAMHVRHENVKTGSRDLGECVRMRVLLQMHERQEKRRIHAKLAAIETSARVKRVKFILFPQ